MSTRIRGDTICLRYSARHRMSPYRRSRKDSHQHLTLPTCTHYWYQTTSSVDPCSCKAAWKSQYASIRKSWPSHWLQGRMERERVDNQTYESRVSRIQGPALIEPRKSNSSKICITCCSAFLIRQWLLSKPQPLLSAFQLCPLHLSSTLVEERSRCSSQFREMSAGRRITLIILDTKLVW